MIGRRKIKARGRDGKWRVRIIVLPAFVEIEGMGWQNVAFDILERRWSARRGRWIYRVPSWHWRAGDFKHG